MRCCVKKSAQVKYPKLRPQKCNQHLKKQTFYKNIKLNSADILLTDPLKSDITIEIAIKYEITNFHALNLIIQILTIEQMCYIHGCTVCLCVSLVF